MSTNDTGDRNRPSSFKATHVLREVVPEHVRVLQVGLRVTLLGVDEVGELGRVADEEDGGVVEDPVAVALFGTDLDGESTRVTGGIG